MKVLKWLLSLGFLLCIMIIITDNIANPEQKFLSRLCYKYHNSGRDFIVSSFSKIPKALPNQMCLLIGADVTQEDGLFALRKGYRLITIQTLATNLEFMAPNEYAGKVCRHHNLNCWDSKKLPPLNLVMASFTLPFYFKERFPIIWKDIDNKIQKHGYFIGNFFHPSLSSLFSKKARITFHTKQDVVKLFKNYKILDFKEVNFLKEMGFGPPDAYYYEIFAQKIR